MFGAAPKQTFTRRATSTGVGGLLPDSYPRLVKTDMKLPMKR